MDEFEWTVLNESKLLEAMIGHKPVGVTKYFQMVCIWEKLQEFDIDVTTNKIWNHLETMYNLESLDDLESLPFPNEERDFYLPEIEFGAMKVKKEDKSDDKSKSMSNTPKRHDSKDTTKLVSSKEDKTIGKKVLPRRDSKDGKEMKSSGSAKKEIKKDSVDKSKHIKGRSSASLKEEEKTRSSNKTDDAFNRLNKRPTRLSMKPEEMLSSPVTRKSQSPLTIPPTSANKRRRI